MRTTASATYPVDRYLVEGSKNIEEFKILKDDNWNTEPVLSPGDELVLNKLQDMLQSTADDLKLLSREIIKYRDAEPKIKTLPTPLDKEFNEKVRIEEVVNAKFYGYKIIEKPVKLTKINKINVLQELQEKGKPKQINIGVQATVNNRVPNFKKKVVNTINIEAEINEKGEKKQSANKNNAMEEKVVYREVHFQYIDPVIPETPSKLKVQEMPSVNIRSALTEQRVIQLDIQPQIETFTENVNKNILVIEAEHYPYKPELSDKREINTATSKPVSNNRKITIMSSDKLDESSSNQSITSSKLNKFHHNKKPSNTASTSKSTTKEFDHIEQWKEKLNHIYAKSTSKHRLTEKHKDLKKKTISNVNATDKNKQTRNKVHNAEYIPYSKLTLGGINVNDIEKEMASTDYKNSTPLTPILCKLLSRENSMSESIEEKHSSKILTTSDENLLHEVLNIEKTVTNTISENFNDNNLIKSNVKEIIRNNIEENLSYEDDFENSDNIKNSNSTNSTGKSLNKHSMQEYEEVFEKETEIDPSTIVKINTTFMKTSNLSMKNTVDVFEYVHLIDRQDTTTQSIKVPKIYPKETQTSPTEAQPAILNKVCSTTDIEKDFVQKIILECSNLMERNMAKPGTSKSLNSVEKNIARNVSVHPKNTQTSPTCVKTVMTSPTRTKTRTTSPLFEVYTVNCSESTLSKVANEDVVDDIPLINSSLTKFSLHLPEKSIKVATNTRPTKNTSSSESSSADVESFNSSDFSSLGEIKLKLNRKVLTTTSESSVESSVTTSKSNVYVSDISKINSEGETSSKIVGTSEGELSLVHFKSEGEVSLQLL